AEEKRRKRRDIQLLPEAVANYDRPGGLARRRSEAWHSHSDLEARGARSDRWDHNQHGGRNRGAWGRGQWRRGWLRRVEPAGLTAVAVLEVEIGGREQALRLAGRKRRVHHRSGVLAVTQAESVADFVGNDRLEVVLGAADSRSIRARVPVP